MEFSQYICVVWKKWIFPLLFLGAPLGATVNQNGDFQIWDRVTSDQKIKGKWGARLIGEQRWGDNASFLFFAYAQAQLVYWAKKWEIAPGYRQEFNRKNSALGSSLCADDRYHLLLSDP